MVAPAPGVAGSEGEETVWVALVIGVCHVDDLANRGQIGFSFS